MDSTIYFLAGSAVCLKVIPVLEVMSSSWGTGRPAHLVALAPAGGGGGCGWPPCAAAWQVMKKGSARARARRADEEMCNDPFRSEVTGFGRCEWRRDRGRAAWLLVPYR